jgi:ABC-type branched-subunit amino acid transport system substrate-binding protein
MTGLVAPSSAVLAVAGRSRAWVWLVAGGLALGALLAAFVIRAIVRALPDDLRRPMLAAARDNSAPLGVGTVLVIGSLVFALYSASLPPADPAANTQVDAGSPSAPTTDDGTSAIDDGDAVAIDGGTGTTLGGRASPSATRVPGQVGAGTTATTAASAAASGPYIKPLNLFTGASNTRGITADTIKICGHAPLVLGPVLNTKPEDLLVFWQDYNARGGVHRRKVEISLEDDRYESAGGVPAAQACRERDPFFILGSIGSDVVPPVREWAEQNRELYIYGFAAKAGSEKLRYSYSATITQEETALVMARLAAERFPAKLGKVGLLWRNSSNIEPGRNAFKQEIARRGGKVIVDIPVQKSQGNYTQEIIELQNAGAQMVFILDDAVSQINVMKQAATQEYRPQWLIFALNLQTQTLGDDALNPPLVGVQLSPAYEHGRYDGPYAAYADEMRLFEAAYAKYSPNTDLAGPAGDIAWGTWIGSKALAGLLDLCGPECTRNRFAGLLEGGLKAKIGAACELDFSGDGHHGGHAADVLEAYRTEDGRAAWRTPQRCLRPS